MRIIISGTPRLKQLKLKSHTDLPIPSQSLRQCKLRQSPVSSQCKIKQLQALHFVQNKRTSVFPTSLSTYSYKRNILLFNEISSIANLVFIPSIFHILIE